MASPFDEALAAHQAGDLARARALYAEALASGTAAAADVLGNLSALAFVERNPSEAEAFARRGIAADPEHANLRNALGLALKAQGRLEAAAEAFAACVARDPRHHLAWGNLAGALGRLDRHAEAIAAVDRAVALAPGHAPTLELALYLRLDCAGWDGLDELIALASRAIRRGGPINPFALFSCCLDPEELRRAARAKARSVRPAAAPPWPGRAPRADGRLRVGFLSCTLRSHADGYLMREMLEAHDRDRFAFVAYPFHRAPADAFTEDLLASFDAVIDIAGRSDAEAVAAIRADAPDILIDVDLYANGARPEIAAARCAPIQLSWLGCLTTAGAPWIDGILADDVVIPPALERFYDERVVRIPGGFCPNEARRVVSDRFAARAEVGLPEGATVLCGFNQLRKVTPPLVAAWAEILRALPDAVLWLWRSNALGGENLSAALRRAGVAPGRVILAEALPHPDHLSRLRFADVFLDAFPYNGLATASDMLAMGVPTVTLSGRTFQSRVCGSLLARLGLSDWIAEDPAGYVARAIRLGRDPALRDRVRVEIAEGLERTRLFDGAHFARRFEATLAALVERQGGGAG